MMVLRYKKLLSLWETYQAAINMKPYDGDIIQSWGMAFAAEWAKCKRDICADFEITPEDFNYSMKDEVMKRVVNVRRSLTESD
jgi:hypothetical protein